MASAAPEPSSPKIVIIGAGPTGLGAAYRLQKLGYTNYVILDSASEGGGLGSTIVDEKGFLWDLGGHVIFSHYEMFDRALDETLGDGFLHHERESWVWMRDRFIAYPLQCNIRHLPADDLMKCLSGLVDITRTPVSRIGNFHDWILAKFGPGLAEVFMTPYNYKVWAYHPRRMDHGWMGERVAVTDIEKVLHNVVHAKDEKSWGPNATFRFPLHGGTGNIWKTMARNLPAERVKLGSTVTRIDAAARRLTLSSGEEITYDKLISTVPMDVLVSQLLADKSLAHYGPQMVYSSTHVIGIGLAGAPPAHLKGKCWMYFPEDDCPFYRVTLFSHYSPHNVPEPGKQWSLMCEVSESPDKPAIRGGAAGVTPSPADVIAATIEGLKAVKFITEEDEILSKFHIRLEHGYPTPFLGRDAIVHAVDKALKPQGIWSRGRFGAWKYEVANQDHSFMQGVEAADAILFGAPEATFNHPSVVNAGKAPLPPTPAKIHWG